jgi:hypothetical protein
LNKNIEITINNANMKSRNDYSSDENPYKIAEIDNLPKANKEAAAGAVVPAGGPTQDFPTSLVPMDI